MRDRRDLRASSGNFLGHEEQSVWFSWPLRSLAVLCAVAVAIGGLHLVQPTPSERVEQGAAAVSAAQKFADAATAAFTGRRWARI